MDMAAKRSDQTKPVPVYFIVCCFYTNTGIILTLAERTSRCKQYCSQERYVRFQTFNIEQLLLIGTRYQVWYIITHANKMQNLVPKMSKGEGGGRERRGSYSLV